MLPPERGSVAIAVTVSNDCPVAVLTMDLESIPVNDLLREMSLTPEALAAALFGIIVAILLWLISQVLQ
jgi:hypothetical protein